MRQLLKGGKKLRRKEGGKATGGSTSFGVRDVNRSLSGDSTQGRTKSREEQEQHGQPQLLPGLPDHITLDLITTRLSWTDVLVLPSISHAWQHAVHTHQVHHARVHAQTTESLHLFLHDVGGITMGVHSSGDKNCYRLLPSIIKKEGWFLSPFRSVLPSTDSLFACDGKIYVTGAVVRREGSYFFRPGLHIPSGNAFNRKSFSLDLAGLWQWTECANKPVPPRLCGSFPYEFCACSYPCSIQVAI